MLPLPLLPHFPYQAWANPTITIFSRQSQPITPRSPHIMQSLLSLPSLLPPHSESCLARLMRINSNLCWGHPAQPTKPGSCLSSSSWVPSVGLSLHMESNEFQTAVRWWLGVVLVGLCAPFARMLLLIPWVTMLQPAGMGEMW